MVLALLLVVLVVLFALMVGATITLGFFVFRKLPRTIKRREIDQELTLLRGRYPGQLVHLDPGNFPRLSQGHPTSTTRIVGTFRGQVGLYDAMGNPAVFAVGIALLFRPGTARIKAELARGVLRIDHEDLHVFFYFEERRLATMPLVRKSAANGMLYQIDLADGTILYHDRRAYQKRAASRDDGYESDQDYHLMNESGRQLFRLHRERKIDALQQTPGCYLEAIAKDTDAGVGVIAIGLLLMDQLMFY